MENVLLAIDGSRPDQKALAYAVDLCQRIKAGLKILQILPADQRRGPGTKTGAHSRARAVKDLFQANMMAAAFAEAGEHETALALSRDLERTLKAALPAVGGSNIPYELQIRRGEAATEIAAFIREHKDITVAIYDHGDQHRRRAQGKSQLRALSKKLPVPLVTVHS